MNSNFSFVAKIQENRDLKTITDILKHHNCTITKISYNSRLDEKILFFEIDNNSLELQQELKKSGFLLTSIQEPVFLKIKIHLKNKHNQVAEIISKAVEFNVQINFIEYDEEEQHKKDQMSIMLNAENSQDVKNFLDYLKSEFTLKIMEYTPSDDDLDSTIFYINFANKIKKFASDSDESFILSFLADINSIALELKKLGYDPEDVFMKIYENGETLANTTGDNFYAEYQIIDVKDNVKLYCFQPPCGGNVYILNSPDECLMIDTGYGIYHDDIIKMLNSFGLWQDSRKKTLFISHGDADHCGGAGKLGIIPYSHPGTIELINTGNRAYKSVNENSKLEQIYTKMIATFSKYCPPIQQKNFKKSALDKIGAFPVFGELEACGLKFYVLESHGGHQYGQLFLLEPEANLFFTVDSMLNMKSISQERSRYNQLADLFMTSVNVDSNLARKEREDLTAIAAAYTAKTDRNFHICCGHGAISLLKNGKLVQTIENKHYGRKI